MVIYMFFDRCAQSYIGSPMLMDNDKIAVRNMKVLVNNRQFPYAGIVEDLQLFRLGTIDLNTGKIDSDIALISSVSDFVDKKEV